MCREADLVVLSCVRAPFYDVGRRGVLIPGIGFLSDQRRMNVALTRARRALWVVGHHGTLYQDKHWKQLLTHASSSGLLFSVVQSAAPPPAREITRKRTAEQSATSLPSPKTQRSCSEPQPGWDHPCAARSRPRRGLQPLPLPQTLPPPHTSPPPLPPLSLIHI